MLLLLIKTITNINKEAGTMILKMKLASSTKFLPKLQKFDGNKCAKSHRLLRVGSDSLAVINHLIGPDS